MRAVPALCTHAPQEGRGYVVTFDFIFLLVTPRKQGLCSLFRFAAFVYLLYFTLIVPQFHCVPATLLIVRLMRNDMSEDHYEMIGKVAFGVNRPRGGCTGCVGVNIAWTVRW